MNKIIILLIGLFLAFTLVSAQVYIDPSFDVPAQVSAFQVEQAPTIDGDATDWANVPWSATAYYNDRDFNGDGFPDPAPDRHDIYGRFKSVWINDTNMLYLLIERYDDEILSNDDINWYNVDGFEIRVDPLNMDNSGEPGGGNEFNIGFRVGKDEHNGIEGPLPTYEAKWSVDESVFPTKAVLELALTLLEEAKLSESDIVGFHIYFNDTDNDDDSPESKNACLQFWPQLYSDKTGEKLSVDATWANIHSWGDLLCAKMPTTHTVTGGGVGAIQAAINSAEAGDIIKIGPGEYFENITIDKANLRLIGTMTETDTSKIFPDDTALPALAIAGNDVAPNVFIQNLYFNGNEDEGEISTTASLGISIGSAGAIVANNIVKNFDKFLDANSGESIYAHNIVIEGNVFHNGGSGVYFNRPNTIFHYNELSDVFGNYGVDSKGLQTGDIINIGFNTISDIRQCGIGWGGDGGTFAIHHNTIFRSADERDNPSREMDDGIENQESVASISYIYNNTIVGWDSDGMQLNGPSSYFLRNNIVILNDNFAFDIRNVPAELDVDYCVGAFNGSGNFDANYTDSFGSNILEDDPRFRDEFLDDYSLETNSPAIDAGEAEPFGFKVFFAGTTVDMGSIESGVAPVTSVTTHEPRITTDFYLQQNYPNPFNPSTTIQFNLATAGRVRLNVYDVTGRLVANLIDAHRQPGFHKITWNATNYASGVYFYTLTADGLNLKKKMLLVK